MKKNKEHLVASKKISLRVNADKTQYMVMFHEENTGKNHNTETGNKSFEMVEQFQCLGTALTIQNCIHEQIKSRMRSGNACCHLVQSLLSSSLLSKNIKIKLHRNIIFSVVLYGCETWLLTPREECRLTVFKNRVLRELFGYEVDRVPGE
jgi:hypothetical protein